MTLKAFAFWMLCLFIVYWYLICMIDLHKGIIPHMLIYLMNVFVIFLFTWSIHLSFMSMDLIYLLRFEPNNYCVSFVYRHRVKLGWSLEMLDYVVIHWIICHEVIPFYYIYAIVLTSTPYQISIFMVKGIKYIHFIWSF